jgi:hypothetical protein
MRSSANPAAAVDMWREQVEASWGGDLRRTTLDAVAPLIESALRGAASVSEALTALGHRAGYDGHPLVEVADWVALLAPLAPRRLRPAIRAHRSAYLLAEAWAAGRLAQPPADGQERMDHLELRLGELYDHCEALGLAVDREVALAVVAIHGLPGCAETRHQVLTEATTAAHRIFTAGESVVALDSGRVLVLAERRPNLPVRTRRLAQAVADAVDWDGVQVRHWIEPLPSDRIHLADHLRLLVA